MGPQQVLLGFKNASGSTFNPQTQGTLASWYDASTLGLSNGTQVTSWPDSKTGNPYPLSQSANTAVYATSQQNGLSTVNFATAANRFTGGPLANYPTTLAAVINLSGSSSGSRAILGGIGGGIEWRIEGTTNYMGLVETNTAYIGASTSAVSSSGYHLVVATLNSSSYAYYIDGVAAGSGSNSASTNGSSYMLGAQTTAEFFLGYIGEVQIYTSVLSSGDLSALHSYAVSKWATP